MSRPARRRPGPLRSPVGFAFLLAALLAVVALAARGAFVDGGGGESADLPPVLFSYLYAAFLVAAVTALPLLAYLYARERPETPAQRRRRHVMPLVFVVGITIFLAIFAARYPDRFSDIVGRLRIGGGNEDEPSSSGRSAADPPAPEWFPLLIVASFGASAVFLYAAWRRVARRRLRKGHRVAAALSEALEGTLDDVRDEADPRRAIILAYARMEQALERCGVGRHGAEAPLEYVARVLLELEVTPEPVHALADLFEQAKFSHHPMDGRMKAEAIEALEAIRAELLAE
jgi:membrane protein implicated in regulation of membrane protease activity